jgi:hypothetical protein
VCYPVKVLELVGIGIDEKVCDCSREMQGRQFPKCICTQSSSGMAWHGEAKRIANLYGFVCLSLFELMVLCFSSDSACLEKHVKVTVMTNSSWLSLVKRRAELEVSYMDEVFYALCIRMRAISILCICCHAYV